MNKATTPPSVQEIRHAAKSDLGLRRANNQDSLAVATAAAAEAWHARGHVFMVADGMGAHAAGELASKIATDVVPLTYQKLLAVPPPQALVQAFEDANRTIFARGSASADFKGMGTTGTLLALLPQGALVAHVGDSRAYRLRGMQIDQLTFDHSLIWEIRAGTQIPLDMIPPVVSKNIITRSLGPNPRVQVDLEGPFPLEAGDTFLLCSDGLSGQVADEELGAVLELFEPEEAVNILVHLANLRGGPDNITVIVAKVAGTPSIAPALSSVDGGGAVAAARHTAADRAVSAPASGAGAAPSEPDKAFHGLRMAAWAALAVTLTLTFGLLASGLWSGALVASTGSLIALGGVVATEWRANRRRAEGSSTSDNGRGVGNGAANFANRGRGLLGRAAASKNAWDRQPFGRGPYATADCTPRGELVARFAEIADQLQEVAREEDWSIDADAARGFERAAAAAAEGRHADAIRDYLRAIAGVMDRLKRPPRAGSGEMADELGGE